MTLLWYLRHSVQHYPFAPEGTAGHTYIMWDLCPPMVKNPCTVELWILYFSWINLHLASHWKTWVMGALAWFSPSLNQVVSTVNTPKRTFIVSAVLFQKSPPPLELSSWSPPIYLHNPSQGVLALILLPASCPLYIRQQISEWSQHFLPTLFPTTISLNNTSCSLSVLTSNSVMMISLFSFSSVYFVDWLFLTGLQLKLTKWSLHLPEVARLGLQRRALIPPCPVFLLPAHVSYISKSWTYNWHNI